MDIQVQPESHQSFACRQTLTGKVLVHTIKSSTLKRGQTKLQRQIIVVDNSFRISLSKKNSITIF